jgi:hypothetical protein
MQHLLVHIDMQRLYLGFEIVHIIPTILARQSIWSWSWHKLKKAHMLGDPIKLMVIIANYVYRSLFMTIRRKIQIYNWDCFLVISNILQLKILKLLKNSHKCQLVTNLMTSSMFGWSLKIGIQFHSLYEIPHGYGHSQLGCNYFGGMQNHTTCWNLILTCGNIWLINPL